MAKMIRNAVAPFAAVLVGRARRRARPDRDQFDKAGRGVEQEKQGINETTAEKTRAAKDRCKR